MANTTVQPSVLDAIGNTPLVSVDGIWVKLEFLNPSGSIKDRIAKYIIERAESEGLLRPGDTIVEASSGNTGNALAMVAAAKGYRAVIFMPEGLSDERRAISSAYGAEVRLVGDFHVNAALAASQRAASLPGHFRPAQFETDWNVEENELWLGQEILDQLPQGVEPCAFVSGVGTGGTVLGVGRALRRSYPGVQVIAMEPTESLTMRCGEVGRHPIEGIADGFVPALIERYRDEIDDIVSVSGEEAVAAMREVSRSTGMLVGPSSGANLVAAKRIRDRLGGDVVTVFADAGEKYLSTVYRLSES